MAQFDEADEDVLHPAVEEVAAGRHIKNPDDVIGFCSECKNPQPNQYMERNVFAQEGSPPPCKWCGGVVIITYAELADENLKNRLDAGRGIGSGHGPS